MVDVRTIHDPDGFRRPQTAVRHGDQQTLLDALRHGKVNEQYEALLQLRPRLHTQPRGKLPYELTTTCRRTGGDILKATTWQAARARNRCNCVHY